MSSVSQSSFKSISFIGLGSTHINLLWLNFKTHLQIQSHSEVLNFNIWIWGGVMQPSPCISGARWHNKNRRIGNPTAFECSLSLMDVNCSLMRNHNEYFDKFSQCDFVKSTSLLKKSPHINQCDLESLLLPLKSTEAFSTPSISFYWLNLDWGLDFWGAHVSIVYVLTQLWYVNLQNEKVGLSVLFFWAPYYLWQLII